MRKTQNVCNILHVDSDADGKTQTFASENYYLNVVGGAIFLLFIHAGIFLVRVRFDVQLGQLRGAQFGIEGGKI